MNVITKFSALGLAAVLFAACSDSSSDNGDGNLTPEITGIGLTTTGGSTVTNYKVSNVAKAPRRADAVNMPAYNKPADAIDITTVTDLSRLSGNYYVPAKKEFTFKASYFNLGGCNLYVENGATFNWDGSRIGNLYVNTSGTVNLTVNDDPAVSIQGPVVNYGTFNVKNETQSTKSIHIIRDFYSNNNLSLQKSNAELNVSSVTLYVNGSVRAKKFEAQEGAKVIITGDAHVEDGSFISKNSDVTINGYLAANSVDLGSENGNTIKVDKYIEVKKQFGIGGKTSLYANSIDASCLKDGEGNLTSPVTAYINDDAMIYVNNAGYLTFDNLTINNNKHIQIAENAGVACFKARSFNCVNAASSNEPIKVFSTPSNAATFLLELSNIKVNQQEIAYDDAVIDASYYDYADAQTKDGVKEVFNKDLGYRLNKTDFGNLPKLDLLSTVENNTNDYMSATCIAPVGDKLYVSYHTRGTQHGANIEVFNVSGNNVSVTQTLKDNDNALDFNHCMVANNKLYLSGSHINAGGGFAYIDIKGDGTLNTTSTTIDGKTREPLQFVSLDNLASTTKVDANWAAMFKGNLIVATTAGYKAYTLGTDGPVLANTVATTGKAKSLAVSNDGSTIYGLSFKSTANDDATPVEGWLQYTGNATMSGNLNTTELGNIAPTNGKNSLFADQTAGSRVLYACLGQYGVRQVNGSWTLANKTWTIPTNKDGKVKGYANGVASDDNYVYVACGGYGLVVLDKATGEELCHRTVGASANYVAVSNGYIYVANGLNRVQVFKLNYTRK